MRLVRSGIPGLVLVLAAARASAQTPSTPSPSPQTAQTPPAGAAAEVDALIEQGVTLRTERRDDEALALFRRAYELNHSARALAQIALAEQALGRWVDADRHMTEALAMQSDPWIARNAAPLRQAQAVIFTHVGSLEVRSNAPAAEVWIGGARVATLPMQQPVRVQAGTAQIELRADGYATVTRPVAITPGGLARESIDLTASGSDVGGGGGGGGEPVAPAWRRATRVMLVAEVGGGYPFLVPSLGVGAVARLGNRVYAQGRADLAFELLPQGTGLGYGGAVGVDGTIRFRPISDSSSWYLGAGIGMKLAFVWQNTTTIMQVMGMSVPVTALTGPSVEFPIGGVVETGILLGEHEHWDLALRFMGGFQIVSGFISLGYLL